MKDKMKKRILAKILCFVLIINSSISVMAEDGSVSSEGDNNITSEYTDESETSEASEETSETSETSEETSESSEVSEETSESSEASEDVSEESEASKESNILSVEEHILVTRSLKVNASITDNVDENPNTFTVLLEAWVEGSISKSVNESEVEEIQKVQDAQETDEQLAEAVSDQEKDGQVIVKQTVLEEGTICDSSAVLRNQLSQYFEYDCSCEEERHTCVEVYTAAWDGSQFLDPVQIDPVDEQSTISVVVNDSSIEVSGFDYKEHTVVAGEVSGNGQKLIVKASVEAKAGFWGGNNVPVTEEATAVYMNGEAEATYATLRANVPVCVDIATQDKTIYYGGSISDKDLLDSITAGYKTVGTTETNGVVCVNDDGTLTPAEDWMDDYAVMTWKTYAGQNWTKEVSNILGNSVSKTGTGCYEYAVTITPTQEAIYADTNAGAVNPMEGVTDSATGFNYVLIPVIRFRNTIINHGFIPDQEYFENYNKVSVEWMEMNGFCLESEKDDDPYTYPAPDYNLEPTLSFTYEPIDPTFTADTGVNVIVSGSNDNAYEGVYIANAVIFGSLLRTLDLEASEGTFTISVNYATSIELPATGGIGTAGFRNSGLVLMLCAIVLIWKKKRSAE